MVPRFNISSLCNYLQVLIMSHFIHYRYNNNSNKVMGCYVKFKYSCSNVYQQSFSQL